MYQQQCRMTAGELTTTLYAHKPRALNTGNNQPPSPPLHRRRRHDTSAFTRCSHRHCTRLYRTQDDMSMHVARGCLQKISRGRGKRQKPLHLPPYRVLTPSTLSMDLSLKCLSFSNTPATYYCQFCQTLIFHDVVYSYAVKVWWDIQNSCIANCQNSVPVKEF